MSDHLGLEMDGAVAVITMAKPPSFQGEHNRDVLRPPGLDDEEVTALRQRGIVIDRVLPRPQP